jgi:hypothetical protein
LIFHPTAVITAAGFGGPLFKPKPTADGWKFQSRLLID